jgi:hypothetical protein
MYNQYCHHLYHKCTPPPQHKGALDVVVLAQEGPEPELHVILGLLDKPIALGPVVKEVA